MQKILFYIFLLVIIIPNLCLSVLEPMGIIPALANVLFPLGVIYLLMCITPKIGRTVWLMFPLIFIDAFQIILLSLYGRSVIAVDMFLNVATTNSAEVSELLENLLPIIFVVAILYIPVLVLAVISIRKKERLSRHFIFLNRKIAYSITVIGAALVMTSYATTPDYSVKRDLYPVNAIYNVYLACDRTVRTSHYKETSKNYKYDAVSTHPDEMREAYILIIGETSRADNWQILGYDRGTNPRLSKRQDVLAAGGAMSESNTTHKSVPMLLSPVDATNFNDEIYRTKSLISAFKEAGYATAYISNQRYNRSFIDFFSEESDTAIFIREQLGENMKPNTQPFYDVDLLPIVKEILSKNKNKQLIVLHTYGSHFNYKDRYDKQDARFTPDDYTEAMKSERDRLINAYDNTIVATDRLISECINLLDSLDNTSAGLLYTSDHGEDIFDNGSSRFLHASPLPTYFQLHVPMIGWFSSEYQDIFSDNYKAAVNNFSKEISTSRSFCPTALQMAGIETEKSDTTASLMSESYKARDNFLYLSDHNVPVLLEDIILTK